MRGQVPKPNHPLFPLDIPNMATLNDAILAAQCEMPPPYRAIPFRDSIAEGGIARVFLVFIKYLASIAEIPLLWGGGYRTSTSYTLQGGNVQGRGSRTQ